MIEARHLYKGFNVDAGDLVDTIKLTSHSDGEFFNNLFVLALAAFRAIVAEKCTR